MNTVELIEKKKQGYSHTQEEIEFLVSGFAEGTIPDYQMSAWLMAVCLQGLSDEETVMLTSAMASSGDMMDMSHMGKYIVDKHSTGGVGDKVTLVVAPLVAACGIGVGKLSGRGLGHTGGTIDKMESIPGMRTELSIEEFQSQIAKLGLAVMGQTENLAPADKKLYALRDVTATVNNLSLIAASVMSKKIASGSQGIVLDVKVGSGAFMKTIEEGIELAKLMVHIGHLKGRDIVALITDMNRPLGRGVGNSLEIQEVIEVLQGNGPMDLREASLSVGSYMLQLAGRGDYQTCYDALQKALHEGRGLELFREFIKAQGGKLEELHLGTNYEYELVAPRSGYIHELLAEQVGKASCTLGAGRMTKDDSIDYHAGIYLHKTVGDAVEEGELIATFYTNDVRTLVPAKQLVLSGLRIENEKPEIGPTIMAVVSINPPSEEDAEAGQNNKSQEILEDESSEINDQANESPEDEQRTEGGKTLIQ